MRGGKRRRGPACAGLAEGNLYELAELAEGALDKAGLELLHVVVAVLRPRRPRGQCHAKYYGNRRRQPDLFQGSENQDCRAAIPRPPSLRSGG